MYDLLAEQPANSEGLSVMEDATQGTYVRRCLLAEFCVGTSLRAMLHCLQVRGLTRVPCHR
jgi:hypothetical protein